MKKHIGSWFRFCLLMVLVAGLALQPQITAYALTNLTVTPLTWDVLGLDSNNVNVGPSNFPVGARICNTGGEAATNVTATFVFDDGLNLYTGDPYINLRSGSLSTITVATLSANTCTDAYFEVSVTRNAGAYNKTRKYHINVTAGNVTGTVSSPTPRQLFVEHLVSQNRNAVDDVKLNGVSYAAGATMSLSLGSTYTIELDAHTATQGYNQLEDFINFPNTIFQVLSVQSKYSADSSTFVSNSSDKLYGDACLWDPNPNSATYRSCIGSDGKIGGTISTVYTIKIIGGVGTTQPLNTLIYDFSGSSYHYNSDYSTSVRFAVITSPLTLTKSFASTSISSGGTSTLTITVGNTSGAAVSGVSLTDTMPTNLMIQGSATSTCGGISNSTSTITLTNATVPTTGCTITATVTSATNAVYTNTTGDLFINGADTGTKASANLTVTTTVTPSCSPATIAQWTFTGLTTGSALPYAAQAGALAGNTANASANFNNGPGSATIDTGSGSTLTGGSGVPSWQSTWKNSQNLTEYYVFQVNTTNYTGTGTITFSIDKGNNGPSTAYVNVNTTGTVPVAATNPQTVTLTWSSITTSFTAGSTIYLFIQAGAGANNGADDTFNIDDVTFTASPLTCTTPSFPTIAKAFSPTTIGAGGTSTLTFTLTNPNAGTALSQVAFSDPLPSGVQVANPPTASITGTGCTGGTFAPAAGNTTVSLTGLTIPASGSCTVSVKVTAAAAGVYANTTGNISSLETGTNTGAGGSASATLTTLAPPSIAKSFSPNPIYSGATSTLTFTITNPNSSASLSGVAFSDTFPTGVTVSTAPPTPQCGGGTVTSTGGNPGSVTLANGTLTAGGTCTVSVVTTSSTVGSYANTSGSVSAVISGVTYTGNTASDTLGVQTIHPSIAILKQVSTSTSGPWSSNLNVATGQNVYYRFTIENTGDVALSPVSINDSTLNVSSCVWPATLPVGTSSVSPTATCIVGPVAAVSGTHSNTATAQGTYSGTVYTSTTSTAVYATTSLTLVKSLTSVSGTGSTATSFGQAGNVITYGYTITNTGAASLALPAVVTDTNTTVSCPATDSSGNHDGNLDQNENIVCTATYTVTAFDIAVGSVTNVAYATVNSVKSNNSSVVVYENLPDLVVTKTNSTSSSAITGNPFNWALTVSNIGPQAASFSSGQTILTDQLPNTGATYGSPATGAFTNITNSGNISCSVNGSFLLTCTVSGTSVTIGATTGSFTVTVSVTPTASGSLTNPLVTVDPNSQIAEGNEGNNTGGDSVTVTTLNPPTISKSFATGSVASGGNTNLTVTIGNTNTATITLTSALTDTFPTGMTINTAGNTGTCTGVTATAGAGSFTIANGTAIPSGGCTVIVNVTSSTAGSATNTIPAGTLQTNGGNNASSATATLTVVAPPTITKTFGTNPIATNGTSVITFTITNPAANTVALTGVAFTDTYPSGMQNASTPAASTTCTGGTVTAAANGPSVSLSGASIAVNSSCTVTVTITVTTSGTKTNSVKVSSTNGGTGNTSTVTLGVISATKSVIGTSEDSTTGTNVAIGEIVRYRLVMDLPEGTTTNLQVLDNIVTNLRYLNDGSTKIAFVCNSGAACATSSNASIGSNPVISGNSSNVTPTFVLPAATITNNSGGATTNPFPSGDDPLFSLGNVTNSDSDADSEYVVIEFNALIANTAPNINGANRSNTFTVMVGGTNVVTSSSATVTIVEPSIAAITKSVTVTPTDAGDAITYQLQFTNSGTSPAFDIAVTDALDSTLTTPVTVTGSTTGGACGSTASTVSGSYSAPNAIANVTCLNPGGTATITIAANVINTASAGKSFSNSAGLTYSSLPGAGTPNGSGGNNTGSTTPGLSGTSAKERDGSHSVAPDTYTASSNTVTTTLANPSIVKDINPAGTTYAIGATIPYRIQITVPEGVTGSPVANLVDTIPTGLSYVSGSLAVTVPANVTVGTGGTLNDSNAAFFNLTGQTLTLTFGSFTSTASASATNRTVIVTFNVQVNNVVGNQSGTTFTNSVDFTRTNPNGAGTITLTATASVVSVIEPVLAVSKSASSTTPAYNSTLTYTLTVSHTGASNAPAYDTTITDTLPVGLTNLTNFNVSSTAPASCATGVINNSTTSALNITVGTIPLGCTVTITYDVTVSGALNSTQTNSVNAVWTSQPGTVASERTGADGVGGLNDYVASTSQLVTVSGPDLNVLKTDGSLTYTAGATISYTITVDNSGNATANATVVDTFPVALTGVTWTCAGTGGATCTASGSGIINDAVSIPAGASVSYTVNATVVANATGNLVNTATATLTSGTDPTSGNNSSTDTDTPNPQTDLAITKTDGSPTYIAGGAISYSIVVSNVGPSDATGASIADTIPASITGATINCIASGTASCGTNFSAGNSLSFTGVSIPVGGANFITITVNGTVGAGSTGNLVNTATVTAGAGQTDSNNTNNSATDTDTANPQTDLAITKTDGSPTYTAGNAISYTMVVTNAGPSNATGVSVADTIPVAITGTTINCAATGSASCGTNASAGNSLSFTGVSISAGPGNLLTISVSGTVDAATSGSLVNIATVTSGTGQTDPDTTNNSATDTDLPNPQVDLAINKDDGSMFYTAGTAISYSIMVTNAGPSNAVGASVADAIPAAITGTSIGCVASGTAVCGTNASAGNSLSFTGVDIPVGGANFITITVSGTVNAATTGTFNNTATVTVGAGQTDSDTTNNSSTDSDKADPQTDLAITKTDGSTTYTAGNAISYSIVVSNAGPSNAIGASIADTIPAAVTGTTINCAASGTASCGTNASTGNTLSFTGVNIPVGAGNFVTITVNGIVDMATTGNLVNTATVTAGAIQTDLNNANNSATDTDAPNPQADLSITKTDGVLTATPGGSVTYTITASNAGPSSVTGATVADTFPAAITATWTCVGAGGGTCTASGSGNINDTVNLPVGASVTYTVSANISASATGTLSNTATVATPGGVTDPNPANNGATDTDTLAPSADLSITKTDGVTTATPGGSVTYTITASNAGPSDVTGATVADTFPTSLTATWTCVGAGGGTCTASGSGNINDTVDLPTGGSVTYTVMTNISASAGGSLSNTATVAVPGGVTDPTPGNNSATDTDTLTSSADLSITKDDGVTTATPGTSVTYMITASNAGPSDVTGATVADIFPTSLTATWTCVGAGGGTCTASGTGDINDLVDLPVGGSVTYIVSASISSAATGSLTNTATVATPNNVNDPDPSNNSATDTDTSDPQADLAVTKTDGVTAYIPGTSTTYTITASNAGPSDVLGAAFTDTFPAAITSATWTCVGGGGGTCTASGSGNISDSVDLPAGGSVTYTVTASINATATGALTNTAAIAVPAGVTDPNPADNSATDTDTATSQADLSITKTDGVTTATPGGSVTYTITASNAGPSSVTGATVADTFPATITATWTCVGAGGGTCITSGSGDINDTVDLPAGGSVTYTVTATISASATGTLSNTATVAAPGGVTDPTPGNNSATDTDTLAASADLAITKTDGVTAYTPGGSVIYTITASNAGPSSVTGATAADTFPASLTATWTCVGAGGGTCTASGSGNIKDTVNLPAGGSVTYTVTANISAAATGTLSNTATVAAPGGVTDPTPGNNSATDTDTNNPQADLSVIKTDGVTTYVPGNNTIYTITAANAGPSPVTGATLTDTFPVAITSATWTCVGAGGGTCTASGTGNISDTVNLPVGGSVTYTVTATISAAATGSLSNTATITTPAGVTDPTLGNNSATDTDTVVPAGSISGVVYNDADVNGTKSASEAGIVGVVVNLYDSTNTLVATTTTGLGGTYTFTNLPPGSYTVVETDPAGYVSSTANNVPVTVASGGIGTANFGDYQLVNTSPANIQGTVFNDANADGVMNSGETPLAGVTVQLKNNLGIVIATTTTNASGGYSFTNLPAGTYTVVETDPAGYISTTLNDVAVTLSAGTTATVNFGDQASGNATIADPAVTKLGSPTSAAVGDIVVYTITVGNNGNANAANVILMDTKPAFLDIISITIAPNPGLTPVISGNTFTINFGTVAPTDLYTVTVVTRVNSLGTPPGGANNASITTSSGTDLKSNNASAANLSIPSPSNGNTGKQKLALPATGFAPDVVTDLSNMPKVNYASTGDLVLEIPALSIKMPIVGVPQQNGTWNVSWLSKQAGWLQGTAFPSWSGNSVLTGHVYNANGLPGPFVNLNQLKFGDQIIIHAYGQKYIFEVQTNQVVAPNDVSAFNHEDQPWVTLVTCKEYDAKTNTYKQRVVVKAELVKVEWDK